MAEKEDIRTLLVYDSRGKFKITIPADWKVTFGSANGNRAPGAGYELANRELRLYESSTEKQRACFTGVSAFYDLSIPIEREVVSEEGATTWVQSEDGYEKSHKLTRKKQLREGF